MIRHLDTTSIHRITSGQVVIDIATAVKELVENSLDAKATIIEVRFKNYGLDSLEVIDNGSGITASDFESLALKHYTSKLESYDGLSEVRTYGFRGEALSSLCALAEVSVVTATASEAPKAHKLVFNHLGTLKGTSFVSSPKGTTVIVTRLFEDLPVRRKDLQKNFKREFNKSLTLLQAYALIKTNIRISVSNVTPSGKKSVLFMTQSNGEVRQNIANLMGVAFLESIIPLDLTIHIKQPRGRVFSASSHDIRVVGHISKPIFGQGRTTSDRQTYYINSRPCVLPHLSKMVNEVYKSFNATQYPFVVADLIMNPNVYDVNVSPDKRTILLHGEQVLLDMIREELTTYFSTIIHSVPSASKPQISLMSRNSPTIHRETLEMKSSSQVRSDSQSSYSDSESDSSSRQSRSVSVSEAHSSSFTNLKLNKKILKASAGVNKMPLKSSLLSSRTQSKLYNFMAPGTKVDKPSNSESESEPELEEIEEEEVEEVDPGLNPIEIDEQVSEPDYSQAEKPIAEEQEQDSVPRDSSVVEISHDCSCSDLQTPVPVTPIHADPTIAASSSCSSSIISSSPARTTSSRSGLFRNSSDKQHTHNLSMKISTNNQQLWTKNNTSKSLLTSINTTDVLEDSAEAETRLSLSVSKDDFEQMKIVGQFNLGFILVTRRKEDSTRKIGRTDLFIIDQHASDEIFNFERLQRDTVMDFQPLVV